MISFDQMVSLLVGVKSDHIFLDTTTCRCGYKPADQRDWDWHVAGNQAEAILSHPGRADPDV